MSWFGFWYSVEKICYRIARYAHERRDEAFDRDLKRELRRLRKKSK